MIALPPVPHLPGQTPRPDPALFAAFHASVAPGMAVADLARSAAFAGGLAAFDAGYFWEAHELWEPVWMALPAGGAERLYLQGLIQLANAGLKARMGRGAASAKCLARADALLAESVRRDGGAGLGLAGERLEAMRARASQEIAL